MGENSIQRMQKEKHYEQNKHLFDDLKQNKENCVMCNVEVDTENSLAFEFDEEEGIWCMPCAIQESDC